MDNMFHTEYHENSVLTYSDTPVKKVMQNSILTTTRETFGLK